MLEELYKKEVIPKMKERFGYSSVLAVPKITKVIIHTGVGKSVAQKTSKEQEQVVAHISRDLATISGQKPMIVRAKKSISAFKLREGMPAGLKITFRKKRMYDFLERLIFIALPRSRDFRGIKLSAIDKQGNLTIGLDDHVVFPEILPEEAFQGLGLETTVVTNSKSKDEALELYRLMGFPFQKE